MGQGYTKWSENLPQNQGKRKDEAFCKLTVLCEDRYSFGEDVELEKKKMNRCQIMKGLVQPGENLRFCLDKSKQLSNDLK